MTPGRLLAFLCAFLSAQAGFSASSHADYIRSLTFRCQDDYVFSATNTVFSVDIAYLPPEDVSVYLNSIPHDVELVSIRKVTYIPPSSSKQGYGTHVEVTVRFSSPGDVKLFAADLETKEGFFKVPFQGVHVWANMQILKPELSVVVDGAGQGGLLERPVASHISYTVRVKYVSAVKSISYEIPENSIFVETGRMMGGGAEGDAAGAFSPDFQDAVRFDWQPLVPGDYELPAVGLTVQAYNGNLVSLPFPEIAVRIAAREAVSEAPADPERALPEHFLAAFEAPPAEQLPLGGGASGSGSLDDARRLADLYGRERASFPFAHAVLDERKELERGLGLEVMPPQPRRPAFFLLLFLCAAALLAGGLLAWRKFFGRAAFLFVLFLLSLICTLIYAARLSRSHAVSLGGELYPIPESGIAQGGDLPVASVVSILKRAGGWYYVSFNDTSGWIPEDSVILIR